jgi:hypothetical protein
MSELNERQSFCESKLKVKAIKRQSEKAPTFELSYPPNSKIPFMVDCIELKQSKEYGKGLVATKDFRVGDVLMVEDNFAYSLKPSLCYKRCSYCLMERQRNLIPCDSCTKVMYCSKECKTKAWNEFHEFDCEIIDGLNEGES